jgi:hypothetical protein
MKGRNMKTHLTETGTNEGRRLCLTPRNDGQRNIHATHAPLHLPDFRLQTCQECLMIWQESEREFIGTGESLLIGTGELAVIETGERAHI